MSRIKIYEPQEIARFHTPPVFTALQRKKYFSIPEALWEELPVFRKPLTKVGFLLQWGYFRYSGHYFLPKTFHTADVEWVASQVGVSVEELNWPESYSIQSARFHQEAILQALGWKSFPSNLAAFSRQVQSLVEIPALPRKVLEQSRQWLLANQIEVPGYDTLLRIITQAYQDYHQKNTRLLDELLTPPVKEVLEDILRLNPDGESLLKNFKKPSQSEKPQKIKASLALFETLKGYYHVIAPIMEQLSFPDSALNYYAYRTINTRDEHTRQSKDRYLYLLCFLAHQYRIWQDTFVDILLSAVKAAEHQTARLQQQRYFDTNRERKTATRLVIRSRNIYRQQVEDVRWILENPQLADSQKVEQALEILGQLPVFSPQQESLMVDLDYEVNRNEEQDFYALLGKQFLPTHHRISGILQTLSFDQEASTPALLTAIAHFTAKAGKIKEPCPEVSWLSASQQEAIYSGEGIFNKNLYRMFFCFKPLPAVSRMVR